MPPRIVLLLALALVLVLASAAAAMVVVYRPDCAPAVLAETVPLPAVQTQLNQTYRDSQLWSQHVRDHAAPGWVTGPVWEPLYRLLGSVETARDLERALPPEQHALSVCTLLLSPDGIFSHYTSEDEVLVSNDSGLFFAGEPTDCWPRHVRMEMSLRDVIPLMMPGAEYNPRIALMANYATVRYLRISRLDILEQLGQQQHADQVTNVSLYFSDQGALTNFHWDSRPGLLRQFHGRKRVWLVHPQYAPYMKHADSHRQCLRRSRFTGREERPMIPHYSLVVHPGQTLFLPAQWWHQVESLDQPTIGGIVRFR